MKLMTASLFLNIKRYGSHIRAARAREAAQLPMDKKLGNMEKNLLRVLTLTYVMIKEYSRKMSEDQEARLRPLLIWLEGEAAPLLDAGLFNQSTT
jgi:hypothetical protein